MTTETINTVPSNNGSFITDLQNFLKQEDADRYAELFISHVVSGGTHGTVGSLTGTPSALIAYCGGYRVTESGSITYPDDSTHIYVIAHKDTTSAITDWTRVSGTHYLFRVGTAAEPSLPPDSCWLMKVTTASGSISAVEDRRFLYPYPLHVTTTAPTTADDASKGFSVGFTWVDTSTDTIYQCADATTGAAVWTIVAGPASAIRDLDGDTYVRTEESADEDTIRFGIAGVERGVWDGTSFRITGDFDVTGDITVSGNVDGRDVATDGTKLDGIAAGAEVNPDVVSQAEAEAGTATTERIWTAERVKQAIDALVTPAGLVLLSTATANNDATIDITTGIDSTYDWYKLVIVDLIPASDAVDLYLRTSSDGGVSFDSGASDYQRSYSLLRSNGNILQGQSTASNVILVANNIEGTGTNWPTNAEINIYKPSESTTRTFVHGTSTFGINGGTVGGYRFIGGRNEDAIVDALQILMSSGNILSGSFYLYGVKK